MTDHDQDAAIGALTKRYSEAKRTRAALVGELGKVRQALDAVSRVLQGVTSHTPPTTKTVPTVPAYPDPQVLTDLLRELSATCQEIEHTQQVLKDAGVDVS